MMGSPGAKKLLLKSFTSQQRYFSTLITVNKDEKADIMSLPSKYQGGSKLTNFSTKKYSRISSGPSSRRNPNHSCFTFVILRACLDHFRDSVHDK